MGVQTIMLVATAFAAKELMDTTEDLIKIILIIQIVAIAGATLMSRLSDKYGNVRVLIFVVFIWIGVCIAAYFTKLQPSFISWLFWLALVMGGIQSLSRSTYSKYLPQDIPIRHRFSAFMMLPKSWPS
jgi:UMF1 family MFS transporter